MRAFAASSLTALLGIAILAASSAPAQADESPVPAAASGKVTVEVDGATKTCRQQAPQQFLVRSNWFKGDAKAQQKALADAVKYRTEKYGHFPGFGDASMNAHPPKFYAENTTFLGVPFTINKRIIPALRCVEAAMKKDGFDSQYHPKSGSGIRFTNTYRGAEISNHVYGIALDIEPNNNTCCGCVKPWNEHPLCKKKGTPYDRMAMPRTWVEEFEKYGFYWLGHDVLQDTMHFEFLADPDQIFE